ncbi:EpsG family protein [Eubacterium oxidoreducens]|uniref:EpsG family protein n=1 Tax=Eubacterium oxidoreducens TaxID=1732 RepID=A0A1G6BL55_EUBOX|nr:EpsG family protein [Eubacterium oxidoreducens]SDB21315.1 EpsG family protein [Eubacterium oxidoreducens]
MTLYWGLLILSIILIVWGENFYKTVYCGNHWESRGTWVQGLVLFVPLIFFCGMRGAGVGDTQAYITGYEDIPTNFSEIVWSELGKGKLFVLYEIICKHFSPDNYTPWLFSLALISGVFFLIGIKRYSAFFGMSCFWFIASTMFIYMFNGIRQCVVVSVIFAFSNLIVEKKFWKYLIMILILATIHSSVLVMIPVYFIIQAKPWGRTMRLVLVLAVILGVGFDCFWSSFSSVLEDTTYSAYVDYMSTDASGVNIVRVAVIAVPVILALWGRRAVEELEYPLIRVSINMSVITLALYIVAIFSSGMAVGRIAVYFEIYNMISLPWLLKHVFVRNSSRFVSIICIIAYLMYFYVQMVISYGNLPYSSDFLGISL